jgi:hypothetical protein
MRELSLGSSFCVVNLEQGGSMERISPGPDGAPPGLRTLAVPRQQRGLSSP